MKQKLRCLAAVMAIMVAISMAWPAQAASKKSVYVMTKQIFKAYYSGDEVLSITAKYAYKKDGLLKSMKLSGLGSGKYQFSYGKKSLIDKAAYKMETVFDGTQKGIQKYSYNKKGYLTKVITYNNNGKKTESVKFNRNAKGYCKVKKEYNGSGKLTAITKYTVNKKGQITKVRMYNSKKKLTSTQKYVYSGNKATTKTYNAKGKLTETSVIKFAHGDLISETIYDETDGHAKSMVEKRSYKKIKTSKAAKVKKQQRAFLDYFKE